MPSKSADAQALKRLTPNAIDVKVEGLEFRVPMTISENRIMNMVVASQMRAFMQKQIENYLADEAKLTPKDLADLARAAKDMANATDTIYSGLQLNESPTEKAVEKEESTVDFSTLTQVKKDEPSGTSP